MNLSHRTKLKSCTRVGKCVIISDSFISQGGIYECRDPGNPTSPDVRLLHSCEIHKKTPQQYSLQGIETISPTN